MGIVDELRQYAEIRAAPHAHGVHPALQRGCDVSRRIGKHQKIATETRVSQVQLFHCVEESAAMDVVQKDDRYEIQFRILQNPKFGALQGKWLVAASDDSRASVLKFAIEGVVQNIRRGE